MSPIGLKKKQALCKICNSFEGELFNEITLDIIFKRRTWNEIVKYYSAFLPKGVSALNHVNINSHRSHCDPKLVAEDYLRDRGEPSTPAEAIMFVFSQEFLKELDRKKLLTELYRNRLKNLESLQVILDNKVNQFRTLPNATDETTIENRDKLIYEIRSLNKQIDSMMHSLQDVAVKELNSDKGLAQNQQTININILNTFQTHTQNFLQEIVPYVLMSMFPNDPARGKDFLKYLSDTMDKHLGPVLDETKLIQQVNK